MGVDGRGRTGWVGASTGGGARVGKDEAGKDQAGELDELKN